MVLAVYCAIGIFGIFVGVLYIAFSWRNKPPTKGDLKNDTRVKGLMWGAWGAFLIAIADWKRAGQLIFDDPNISLSRVVLLFSYFIGFLIGVGVTFLVVSISIFLDGRKINRLHNNILDADNCSPVKTFFFHGYHEHKEEILGLIKKRRESERNERVSQTIQELTQAGEKAATVIEELRGQLALRKSLARETSDILVGAMDVYRGFALERIAAREACKRLLRSIAQLTACYIGLEARDVNANYMVVQEAEILTSDDLKTVRFTFGEPSRYHRYLALRDYARTGTNFIRLPLESQDETGWEERTLPGAPEAFVRRRPVICNKHAIKFGRLVPKNIQEEQSRYFALQHFDAVLALPLVSTLNYDNNGNIIGVLNLDIYLNGKGLEVDDANETLRELEVMASPLSALIAEILTSEFPFSRSKL